MLSVQLSSCCSCGVFRQYFDVKRIKCSATVLPFSSNYQNNPTFSPGFLGQRFNNLRPGCTFDVILTTAAEFLTTLSPNGPFVSNSFFRRKTIFKVAIIKLRVQLLLFPSPRSLFFSFPFPSLPWIWSFSDLRNLPFDAFSLKQLQISLGWFSKKWVIYNIYNI